MCSLQILVTNSLLTSPFANIFSYSSDCPFVLFMVSFASQRLLNLIKSHLFIFIFITVGDELKKILLQFMSENILPVFL